MLQTQKSAEKVLSAIGKGLYNCNIVVGITGLTSLRFLSSGALIKIFYLLVNY